MPRLKKTATCPFGGIGVGGKWKFWILYHLLSGMKRFGELQRLLPQASRQMLTIQLRELEQVGLLYRNASMHQGMPKVEYSLTELGWNIEPLFRQMYTWWKWYGNQVGSDVDWTEHMGGRWKFWIWYHLLSGPKRFGELQKLLPQASRQMLAIQLRGLEQMGVLQRCASVKGPLKVEYVLTEPGQRSEPMLRQMYAWGRWCCDQIGLEFDWPVNDEPEERIQQPSPILSEIGARGAQYLEQQGSNLVINARMAHQ